MVKKSITKGLFIAILNNEKIAFRTHKKKLQALEYYVRNAVTSYHREAPPQSLKDYVLEEIENLGGTDIEILEDIEIYNVTVMV